MAQINQNDSTGKSPNISGRKQRLIECFQRGMHLAKVEKNLDYAHAMFAECVRHDPGNLQFVEAMIHNLRASAPHSKRSRFKLSRGGSRALTKALHQKDWPIVLATGIELLKADPWDVTTLRAMADACAGLHLNEVELVYLKQALDAEPKNVEVNRHCARSLGRMGQFDQAVACWHRVETLAGKNEETTRMISTLAEEKLKFPNGRPVAARTKQAPVEIEEHEAESSDREAVLTPGQVLEQAIALDPKNAGNYLELAALLLETCQFSSAESVLKRAIGVCGQQKELMDQLKRLHLLRAEEQRKLDEEAAIEKQLADAPIRVPWLEFGLGTAALLLVVQMVPSVRAMVWGIVDFRHWSNLGWIMFNIFILFGLVGIRFGSEFRTVIQRRRVRKRKASLSIR